MRIKIQFGLMVLTLFLGVRGGLSATAEPVGGAISLHQLLRPIEPLDVVEDSVSEAVSDEASDQLKPIRVTAEVVLDALKQGVIKQVEAGESIELSLKAKWVPLILKGDVHWEIYTDDVYSPDNRGNWFPSVVLEVEGEVRETWRLPLRVAHFRPVHMLVQRLNKGAVPTGQGVQSVTCNIYKERGMPIPASVDLSEYELTRTVSQGQLLSWGDLARRPDVRRGQIVDVVLSKGALSVTLRAQCLEDALIGNPVALRNPRSRQEFNGIVANSELVRVEN